MSQVNRRFRLIVDQQVANDFARVKKEDQYAHDQLIVFFEELIGDRRLCENLIDEHFSDFSVESISPFWAMQNARLNVYRVKLYNLGKWRILTAGDHKRREVAILAIMHRDQNYERDAELISRLEEAYERLGFTELGG